MGDQFNGDGMPDELNPGHFHGRVYSDPGVKSRTKQSDASASDVNNIVARHVAHRIPLPNGEGVNYQYGDFSDMSSFHESVTRVQEAQRSFSLLPAHIRKHCHNDPGEFLDMVFDPNRVGELETLGLVDVQKPVAAVIVPAEPVVEAVKPDVVSK